MMVFLEHRTALSALHLGGYGVRLFFVLSGYLIIGGIVRNFDAADASSRLASIRHFFINRAFRILPIYWITLSVAALLLATGATTAISWRDLSWHAAFAGNIYAGQIIENWSISLGHLWSLAVEEQFYLIAAPLIIIAGRRWHVAICAALVGAAIMQVFYLVTLGASDIRIVTDSVIGFGMIALGGCLYSVGPKMTRMTDVSTLALLTFYLALPLMLALWPNAPRWLDVLTVPFLAALLIAAVINRPESLAVKILNIKPLAMFGRVSYGFYIYHYWLTGEAIYNITLGLIDVRTASTALQASILFFFTIIISTISWILVEKPLLAMRTRLAARGGHDRGNGGHFSEWRGRLFSTDMGDPASTRSA